VFKLDDGATVADLAAALATGDPAAALEVGSFAGGTGLVSAGESSGADAVLDLTPGGYAMICFVEGPDRLPHLAHGMLRPFEVTEPGASPPDARPTPDDHVELSNYRFEMPDTVAGDALLSVTNAAETEVHEVIVSRVDDDTRAEDVLVALERGEPLPGTAVGGMQALMPGTSERLQLDLEPGRYVVLCAIPSPDGVPHHAKGMVDEITVRG
jgi:hypothetical protein